MKVNCYIIDVNDSVGWIFNEIIVIFFNLKDIFILYVKWSVNKIIIYLVHLFVSQPHYIASLGVCPGWVQLFNKMHNIL